MSRPLASCRLGANEFEMALLTSPTPEWLSQFIRSCMDMDVIGADSGGAVGWTTWFEEDVWAVEFAPGWMTLEESEEEVHDMLTVDLGRLFKLFDGPPEDASVDSDGISVCGIFAGHKVWMMVSFVPEDEGAAAAQVGKDGVIRPLAPQTSWPQNN